MMTYDYIHTIAYMMACNCGTSNPTWSVTKYDETWQDMTIDHYRPDQLWATDNKLLEVQWSPRNQGIAQRPPVGRYDLARSCKAVAGVARTTGLQSRVARCPEGSSFEKTFNLHQSTSTMYIDASTIPTILRSTSAPSISENTLHISSSSRNSWNSSSSFHLRLEVSHRGAHFQDRLQQAAATCRAPCWCISPTSTVQAAMLIEICPPNKRA